MTHAESNLKRTYKFSLSLGQTIWTFSGELLHTFYMGQPCGDRITIIATSPNLKDNMYVVARYTIPNICTKILSWLSKDFHS